MSRMPPPTCTGTAEASRVGRTTSSLRGRPSRAPSRSTTCRRRAPAPCQRRANATGSSAKTVSRAWSHCSSRTQRPSRMSLAGMISYRLSLGRLSHARCRCYLQKVGVHPQPRLPALLGVELRGDNVVAGYHRRECHAVLGLSDHDVWISGLGVVRMHEVEVGAVVDTLKNRVLLHDPHLVPPHVGDFKAVREPHDTARQNA